GANAATLGVGLGADARVPLDTGLFLNFTFGLDLETDPAPARSFFVRVQGADLGAAAAADNLSLSARVGFAEAAVVPASVRLEAWLNVALASPRPDGTITLGELQTTPLTQLVTLTPRGALDATLPIQVRIGDFTPAGTPQLVLTSANVFGTAPA